MDIWVGMSKKRDIELHVPDRKKPYILSKRQARELAEQLAEKTVKKCSWLKKRDAMVLNCHEVGIKTFAEDSKDSYVQEVHIKVENQPRITMNRSVAGFVARHLRKLSSTPLYTPVEAEEYLRDKLLKDV